MSRRTIPWLAAAAAALAIAGVRAQALTDPMRPPGAQAGLPGSSPDAQADAASGTQLQSVLISRGRKLAVINGVTVPLGGMVGEAKLVKISETEVTLKKGDETEILKLYPGVDKLPSRRATARTGAGAGVRAEKSARQGGSQ